jgi:hypothetical protein
MAFVTCAGCGMSVSASAKEPVVRPRRAEVVEPAAPVRPRGALRAWQIVAALGLLLAMGAFRFQYSARYAADRDELAALERDNAARTAEMRASLAAMKASTDGLRTGVAPCDDVMELMRTPPSCATGDATSAVRAAVDAATTKMLTGDHAGGAVALCTQALADIAAVRTRVGCP